MATKVKRLDDVMTITLDARTWDVECTTIWEKILYVEYCSWAGHEIIDLSLSTIAKKLSLTMTDYSERTIFEYLREARKNLILNNIFKVSEKRGFRNTKLITLMDTFKTRMLKMFIDKYSKERKKLYGMVKKAEEVTND